MTKTEARRLYDSRFWEDMSSLKRAKFQLWEDKLCMPFGVFQEAVEETLGRPVCTHEFGTNRDGLKAELLGEADPPTMQEILGLIPEEKRVVVVV